MTPSQRFKASQPMCSFWAGTEWFSAALEGLWQACITFDEERATAFKTWAWIKVHSAVMDAQRAMAPLPRRARERGVANPGELLDWMATSPYPSPEEACAEKERVLAVRRKACLAQGLEGALLRATLLGERHDVWAARRGVSKSWASRVNARAEEWLARELREHAA